MVASLEERGRHRRAREVRQRRQVVVDQLLLQVDRVRGDDRPALRAIRPQHERHQVRERLADAGTGLDHEPASPVQRLRHGSRHLHLLVAVLVAVVACERAVGAERRRRRVVEAHRRA